MVLIPIDELNKFTEDISIHFDADGHIRSEQDKEEIEDGLFDFFLLAYAFGTSAANTDLGTEYEPEQEDIERVVFQPVAGETWRDRVDNYYLTGGTIYDIQRIAETDMTRIYNTAVLNVADGVGNKDTYKRWVTMRDDRVRESHDYIDNVAVPYNADFYTFDGDHARAPGLFSLPENNINCRCTIELFYNRNTN